MVFALSLKIFWRELKSGYLNSSLFSLILAVTIVSGISLFTDRLEKALSLESAEFLGGDLKFESNEIPREEILEKAKELDVDLVRDKDNNIYIGGIMEHIEEAGIHSGDSSCSIPPYSLSKELI